MKFFTILTIIFSLTSIAKAETCNISAQVNQPDNRLLFLQNADVNSKILSNGYEISVNGQHTDIRLVVDYAKDFHATRILVSTGQPISGKIRNKRVNVYALRISDGVMLFNKTLKGHSTRNKDRLVDSFFAEIRGMNLGCSSIR